MNEVLGRPKTQLQKQRERRGRLMNNGEKNNQVPSFIETPNYKGTRIGVYIYVMRDLPGRVPDCLRVTSYIS